MAARPDYVYVASSWRNTMQPVLVEVIRAAGIDCYDFRNPAPGDRGFVAWSEIDPNWLEWTPPQFAELLSHPIAVESFRKDFEAMQRADAFVLVLPCGRSAHLELGWAAGAGKRTCVFTSPDGFEPELMYGMVDEIVHDAMGLLAWLGVGD